MRRWMWLVAVLTVALLVLGCDNVSKENVNPETTAYAKKAEGAGGPVIARVGDSVITMQDFQDKIKSIPPFYRAQLQSKEGKKRMLDSMVRVELLYQEALKRGLDKDPEFVKRMEDIRKNLLARTLERKLAESEVKVTDEQIAEFYEQNKEKYSVPETAHIYYILVKVPRDASEEQEKAAKEKIDKAYAEIKAGKDFTEVAKKYSEDTFTAKRGGEIKKLRKGARSKEFDKVVFEELKPGEISKPFKDRRGWNIVKLVERSEKRYKDLDEVREQIKRTLQFKLKKEALEKKIEELKKKYGVVIYEDVLFGPEESKGTEESKSAATQSEKKEGEKKSESEK